MVAESERRHQGRVRLSWPIWLMGGERGCCLRGRLVDLTRDCVSFLAENLDGVVPGLSLLVRFSYPVARGESFDMEQYFFFADVLRIDRHASAKPRIALRLHRPLASTPVLWQPGEASAMTCHVA